MVKMCQSGLCDIGHAELENSSSTTALGEFEVLVGCDLTNGLWLLVHPSPDRPVAIYPALHFILVSNLIAKEVRQEGNASCGTSANQTLVLALFYRAP